MADERTEIYRVIRWATLVALAAIAVSAWGQLRLVRLEERVVLLTAQLQSQRQDERADVRRIDEEMKRQGQQWAALEEQVKVLEHKPAPPPLPTPAVSPAPPMDHTRPQIQKLEERVKDLEDRSVELAQIVARHLKGGGR